VGVLQFMPSSWHMALTFFPSIYRVIMVYRAGSFNIFFAVLG